MAENVQFDLVSPERKLASASANAVQIPGADGDITAMAGHEPTILSLRAGLLTVAAKDGDTTYLVTGGFAELSANGVSVLAEMALPKAEVTQDIMSDLLSAASAADDSASTAETAKALDDLKRLAADLGLAA